MRRATIYEAIEQQQPLMQNKIRNQYNITHIHIHKIRTTNRTFINSYFIHIYFGFVSNCVQNTHTSIATSTK